MIQIKTFNNANDNEINKWLEENNIKKVISVNTSSDTNEVYGTTVTSWSKTVVVYEVNESPWGNQGNYQADLIYEIDIDTKSQSKLTRIDFMHGMVFANGKKIGG